MRLALDATYSLGNEISGIGVYSRQILQGLAQQPGYEWDWFYRPGRYWRALSETVPQRVHRRILRDAGGSRSAELFHGLNQRLPGRGFRRQVVTFHDLFVLSGDYSTTEFRERFADQARKAAAAADLVIAVSAFTAGQVEQYLNIPASRIRVVHHGVIPRQIPAVPREKVILCVGALQRRKNQAALVRAFRAVANDWTLVLAGSGGFGSDAILREIQESPAKSRIRVTGYLSEAELSSWYGRASIFAFPSLDEGFGMPVLEAMAAGIPVLSGNRSALPEVCGDAAMLVDPCHDAELATALQTLTENEERRKVLAALGKIHATPFRWERAVAETLAVYRELLS